MSWQVDYPHTGIRFSAKHMMISTVRGEFTKFTVDANLNEAEIEKMVKEAEAHRSEDEKTKQAIELKNQADNLCHSAEKMLKDLGDKAPETERAAIQTQIDDLRAAIQANDADKIKQLQDALQQTLYAMSTKAYEQAGAAAGAESGTGNGASAGSDEEIIDAEFRPADEGVGANK